MHKGENELVRWIQTHMPCDPRQVPIGIGDDMARLLTPGGGTFLTVDMLMDGVDFLSQQHSPEQIGRKALAASLSDCAGMCVQPVAAWVSLALPTAMTMDQARGLFAGMLPLLNDHHVSLAGGDTNSWAGNLVIDVVVAAAAWPDAAPVLRNTACEGDLICVSGPLGGSLSGRHLSFDPRVRLARDLRIQLGDDLHAMMDISDGVSLDLSRMCEASGAGAELQDAQLAAVAHADAHAAAAQDGLDLIEHVLSDGEDFELLFTVAPQSADRLTTMAGCHVIGTITRRGMVRVAADGARSPMRPRGWEHFRE